MPRAKLAKVSVEELKKEIGRRQRKLPALIAARDTLSRLIAELEGLGGAKPAERKRRKKARRAKRAPQAGSLANALAQALKVNGKLSVAEAVAAVQARGYKSKSKTFRLIVNQMLSKNKLFKRVGRGLYALRG